jgi:ABC-2 type transport system ATP-binding protein
VAAHREPGRSGQTAGRADPARPSLFDLDLTVRRGETFGFFGPNGAGKTTIRLLMDLIRADRGTATLLGMDSRRDSVVVKQRVGYLPGELVSFPGVMQGDCEHLRWL